MKTTIVHLSDLHIGRSRTEARNTERIVDGLVSMYRDRRDKPVVLITGDLVDDGSPEQFRTAAGLLSPLTEEGFAVWPVPGNHDYGWNGVHGKARRFKHFKSAFFGLETVSYPHVKLCRGHVFIGLNSMKAECDYWDGLLANGELGTKQLSDLVGIFKKLKNRDRAQKVVVHLHHHPFSYNDEGLIDALWDKLCLSLKDGDELMRQLAGNVDLLLFGHEHDHVDFHGSAIQAKCRIGQILACGKSTEKAPVNSMGADGRLVVDAGKKRGLNGWVIDIDDDGNLSTARVCFE